ncbi:MULTISPECIES: helix-turn-helix domain-containing protein [Mycobacterium]|nr:MULTISPECIES: helix-turn-helix domain-containing protein [Mycobacterium]MDP7732704.1 helix-turn-helix domain-containing protein [Mycobacterium sp. TY813]TDK86601.1 DNA-binding protein [Mycobacterium paragordonae]
MAAAQRAKAIGARQKPVQRMSANADTRRREAHRRNQPVVRMQLFAGKSGKISPMSWATLGIAVRDRRNELGLSQADVTTRGGPSVETLRAIENNRAGRMSHKLRRALERAIEWESGSVEAVLDGSPPRPRPTVTANDARMASPVTGLPSAPNAAERFAMAERLIKMRRTFAAHCDSMPETARAAIEEDFANAAREMEDAMVWMLPWLGEEERAAAIRILSELRLD